MDIISKNDRSRIMARVKSTGNKSTEEAFIKVLKKVSLIGWRRNYSIYGKPDFVFQTNRVAVFVDGCFWHNCPKHCRIPSTNTLYWLNKVASNKQRDREVTHRLKQKGWAVVRFWEHDLKGGRGFAQKISRLKRLVKPRATLDGQSPPVS
ncbi:MAG: very short patch repair endonuclease [Candidatus Glassbacteria bacterium]